MPYNGWKRCERGRHSSTAGLQRWRSTTSRSNIVQERPRLMWMGSAICRLIQRPQKMCSYTFASLKTRKKRRNSCRSSTPPLTSADRPYGSSSATAMTSNPVAAFALKWHRAAPSIRWVAIMATEKTTGAIQSQGPWDTLSIDIVGPLPADHRHEFLIVFVDCYSR